MAGGEVVDYASDAQVPSTLYPAPGIDAVGSCWYLTSQESDWVFLARFVDGDAILGWDPGTGVIAADTGRLPRCTSEPIPALDPRVEVWAYVISYIHDPPNLDVNPRVGDGVTGMETHVGIFVPGPHNGRIVSVGGSTLEVEIEVASVIVDWGDGARDVYPPSTYPQLTGFPDGIVRHVYERVDDAGYLLEVSYDWAARWRILGDAWLTIDVPNTSVSLDYPVAEIVSVITEVG